MRIACLVLGLLVAAAAPGAAQQPLVTDRPDFTESTVAVQRVQLEAGYTFARTGDVDEHTLGELLVRVPLRERIELRVGLNSHVWTRGPAADAAGLEDGTLGVKVEVADGADRFDPSRPAVALLAGTTLPTGAEPFRESSPQPEAGLALGWTASDGAALGANLNYGYASDAGDRFHRVSGSLAYGVALTERVGGYVEAYGFRPEARGGPLAAYYNLGFTYMVSDDFQLDARFGAGLDSEVEPRDFIGVGLAHRW